MEPNAAVRSRLTHSFEVSQMGRYIADQICIKLQKNQWATSEECTALVTFVETACLMHDIGNPPFGHFGEAAISQWFIFYGPGAIIKACSKGEPNGNLELDDPRISQVIADFKEFDGNPQGLRVVTKLQRNLDEHGLNLTMTTVASYLKYVRSSVQPSDTFTSPFTKKCGYFVTESDIVSEVWKELGYSAPQRFPLAYIMEAADDIAYCISDLEDSIEKGLLIQSIALAEIYSKWKKFDIPIKERVADRIDWILKCAKSGRTPEGKEFTYTDFRTSLNRELVKYAANQYIKNHTSVLAGTLPSLIPDHSAAGMILDLLKSYCRENVYCHETVQRIELAGYTAIYGLLGHFSCLLECDADRFSCALDYNKNKDSRGNPIIIEKKLLTLFPKNYVKVYFDDLQKLKKTDKSHKFKEWNLRAHLITDFLSGMTDDFAMTTYQSLSGMRL
jgi:dGTPase